MLKFLHALLFSLIVTSTLAVPVPTNDAVSADPISSYRPYGVWRSEAAAVSDHRSFYLTRY